MEVIRNMCSIFDPTTKINNLPLNWTRTAVGLLLIPTRIWLFHNEIVQFFCGAATQRGSWPPHSWDFLDYTQRRTTVCRIAPDEWSTRRRDLYLTTHNTHNRQTTMPPVGFEPTISTGERPQAYALDRTATGTDKNSITVNLLTL